MLFVSVVIGQSNYIGFGLTVAFTLIFTSVPVPRLAFATRGLGEIFVLGNSFPSGFQ